MAWASNAEEVSTYLIHQEENEKSDLAQTKITKTKKKRPVSQKNIKNQQKFHKVDAKASSLNTSAAIPTRDALGTAGLSTANPTSAMSSMKDDEIIYFVQANLNDKVDYGSIFEEMEAVDDGGVLNEFSDNQGNSPGRRCDSRIDASNLTCDKIKEKYVNNIDHTKTFNRKPICPIAAAEEVDRDPNNLPVEVKVVGRIAYSESYCIGKGSLGTKVYVGLHDEFGNAAIKIFPKRGVDEQKGRLLLELAEIEKNMLLRICRSGKNKNVVEYFGFEEDDHNYYLALELCDFSLHAVYNLEELSEAREFFRNPIMQKEFSLQLISGLAYLHSLQIVHGDFRPKNVLLDLSYRVKIADFGLSSKVDCKDDSFSWGAQPHGADGWFAPEVYLEERKTMAVDIFSAGCVIFLVLTDGRHPFNFNPYHIVRDIFDGSPLRDRPEAYDLCGWMLANKNSERPVAKQVLKHPFLWPAHKRVMYINYISDTIDQHRQLVEDFLVWMPDTVELTRGFPAVTHEKGLKRWIMPLGSDILNSQNETKLSWKNHLPEELLISLRR